MKGSRIALAVIPATVIALSGGGALAATGQGHPAAAAHPVAHRSTASRGAATEHRSAAGHHRTVIINCMSKGEVLDPLLPAAHLPDGVLRCCGRRRRDPAHRRG